MLRRSVVLIVRAAAVVGAVVAIHFLCVVPYRANVELRALMQRSMLAQSVDPQRAAIVARSNLADLDRIARGRRLDPAWYMLYGSNLEILDRMSEAADAYTAALRIDDRPELYVNRAMIYVHLGRTDAAVADLARAVRFNPEILKQLDGDLRARVAAATGPR
jgi:tetratricopeptide (TPR) repeat protein